LYYLFRQQHFFALIFATLPNRKYLILLPHGNLAEGIWHYLLFGHAVLTKEPFNPSDFVYFDSLLNWIFNLFSLTSSDRLFILGHGTVLTNLCAS